MPTFSVDQAAEDTDVETHEVDQTVLVVASDEHAQVGDQDVLETANDGGGEGRVVLGAQHRREDEDKAEDARE